MEKPRPERRASEAERLEKLIANLTSEFAEMPSYKGKAAFMDRIFKIGKIAHSLAWDLRRDAEDNRKE